MSFALNRKYTVLNSVISLAVVGAASLLLAAAPAAPTPPAATTPATQGATAPGAGARGGRGGGGGGRGGGLAAEDRAKIDKLPTWKPGVDEGDYVTAPPYEPAPENKVRDGVPKGKVVTFQIEMEGSKFYPPGGGRRGAGGRGAPGGALAGAPGDAPAGAAGGAPADAAGGAGRAGRAPAVAGRAPAGPETREVNVYIPAGYTEGTVAPLLVCHDAMGMHDQNPAPYLPTILDNMIFDKRLPPMIAVMEMPSANRSVEYDTVSGKFAEYLEAELLPRVAKDYKVTFTKDPDARAVLGGSSGGAASMSMAWFHPELYHRVLIFSGTFQSMQRSDAAPRGAAEYYETLVPNNDAKPLRIWMEVGENDNGGWPAANLKMATALKAKGYHYQFVYAKEAIHVDRPVRAMTLAPALEWLWKDYKPAAK